jgi:hypothetical protein
MASSKFGVHIEVLIFHPVLGWSITCFILLANTVLNAFLRHRHCSKSSTDVPSKTKGESEKYRQRGTGEEDTE